RASHEAPGARRPPAAAGAARPDRGRPARWPSLLRIHELVADAVDREDVARVGAAVADLGAQLRDVCVDGAGAGIALVAPDVLEQLVARDGLALPLDQVAQQL